MNTYRYISVLSVIASLSHISGSAAAQESRVQVVEFPKGGFSGEFLELEALTVPEDTDINLRFHNVPEYGHTLLAAYVAQRGEWRLTNRKEFTDQAEGSWTTKIAQPGEYLICAATEDKADVYPPKEPGYFDECARAFAIWGDPKEMPGPQLSLPAEQPHAGRKFKVSYSGMPETDGARIEIVPKGWPIFGAIPDIRHPTRGRSEGEIEVVLDRPGSYEIRIMYENVGRQVRANQEVIVSAN